MDQIVSKTLTGAKQYVVSMISEVTSTLYSRTPGSITAVRIIVERRSNPRWWCTCAGHYWATENHLEKLGIHLHTTKRLTLLTTILQELCQPFCNRSAAPRAARPPNRYCLQIHTILFNFLLTLAYLCRTQAFIEPSETLHPSMLGCTSVDAHTSLL